MIERVEKVGEFFYLFIFLFLFSTLFNKHIQNN